jgi:hypothetical protein
MWALYAGIVVAVVLGVTSGAGMLLTREPVYRAQPMDSVRVGDPGHNLVGPDWTGDPPRHQNPDDGQTQTQTQTQAVSR